MPSLRGFKAHGFNPSATGFSLSCPRRPLCSPGRRAVASRPDVPQTPQHILPLCPLTSVYHFPAPEPAGPCLLPCHDSDVREDGSQSLVSEHLNWQRVGQPVRTCVCFVSLQHGVCQRRGLVDATQASPGFLPWPARQPLAVAPSSGEGDTGGTLLLTRPPLLHSLIPLPPPPPILLRASTGMEFLLPFGVRAGAALEISKGSISSKHVLYNIGPERCPAKKTKEKKKFGEMLHALLCSRGSQCTLE